MKKLGIIISVICAIITAIAVLGIILANQGKVETFEANQLGEVYRIAAMDFPEAPEGEPVDPTASHPKSDSLVQILKKKTSDTLTGRLRLIEGLMNRFEAMEVKMVGEGWDRSDPAYNDALEKRYVEEITSYGIYRNLTSLSAWEKFCMFAITYRSVMLIFGFLGVGLGLAIASSSNYESDLDESK
ncbi:hypothetical protein [Aristaeella hokkaidonensis]|uniref:Uncharacterized protein n=1 Tax=Aristaeella hokkaidonensis TaxID=3046382 RepID=A0AC61N882_9FIRM|nr:hypothetical protein [Aristaeella hokkaidonensis]QUC66866.1 hypothetical protein JYE49_13630 [Aristaeella hokkaidonensis]SNT94510.1 hypothetical protein SAMN06297421_105169 [Aristaeella hokkaidonensis]